LSVHGDAFNLLPIYDIYSMEFAPKNNGEMLPFVFNLPDLIDIGLEKRNYSVDRITSQKLLGTNSRR
jgi:hypothetical protein